MPDVPTGTSLPSTAKGYTKAIFCLCSTTRQDGMEKATRRSGWTVTHSPRISAPAQRITTTVPGHRYIRSTHLSEARHAPTWRPRTATMLSTAQGISTLSPSTAHSGSTSKCSDGTADMSITPQPHTGMATMTLSQQEFRVPPRPCAPFFPPIFDHRPHPHNNIQNHNR